jgi:predicted transcriptional regulator
MNLKIHSDGYEGFKKRSMERARKLDHGEKIAASKSITFESPMDIFEVLTPERVRLCMVARTKAYSVTGLATALKRDPKSVRRDVLKLEKYGVLRTREEINPGHGRVKIVEPVAKNFVLQTSF